MKIGTIKGVLGMCALAVFLNAFLMPVHVWAVDKYWTGDVVGNWSDGSNWSPSGQPDGGDRVYLINSGQDYNWAYYDLIPSGFGTPVLSSLEIDSTGSVEMTLIQNPSTSLRVLGVYGPGNLPSYTSIGNYGYGLFIQDGGSFSTEELKLGFLGGTGSFIQRNGGTLWSKYLGIYSITSSFWQEQGVVTIGENTNISRGTYTLDNGTLRSSQTITTRTEIYDNASFVQNGGTHYAYELNIGRSENGSYSLSNGTLSVQTNLGVGYPMSFNSEFEGYSGTFTQTGGTVTVGGVLSVGSRRPEGTGTYNLNSGILSAGSEYIGIGTGIFNQRGGINTTDYLDISWGRSSSSSYNLIGHGKLFVEIDETIGSYGKGTFNQTDGLHVVSGNLTLGLHTHPNPDIRGDGTYNLGNGELTVKGNETIGPSGSGTFNQSGGIHTVDGIITIGSSGIYNMTGGSLTAKEIINNGTIRYSGDEIITSHISNHGEFYGKGTVSGSVINAGILGPGTSIGTLTVDGIYAQDILGLLLIELAGYAQGTEYDFLNITGGAKLAGELDVDLLGLFDPVTGSSFNILHAAGTLSGNFSIHDLPLFSDGRYWNVEYGSHDVFLNVEGAQAPVPEPATMLLLGSGLLGLVGLRRKFKK